MICLLSACACLVAKKMPKLNIKHKKGSEFTHLSFIQIPFGYQIVNDQKQKLHSKMQGVQQCFDKNDGLKSLSLLLLFLGLDCFTCTSRMQTLYCERGS